MREQPRIVLTGFMGVGKSTVARCLSSILKTERLDLDTFIEENERRTISEIIARDGEQRFREIETENLRKLFEETSARIISLGGGAWVGLPNRQIIKSYDCVTVWLESSFEHCWRNISVSRNRRPLVENKPLARKLFDERQQFYCLADWHFIVEPHLTSYDVARRIADEIVT